MTARALPSLTKFALCCGLVLAATAQPAAAQAGCALTSIGTAQVAAVRDGATLMLADGRELRLAGIEAGPESRDALRRLVDGQSLRLERLGADPDRYGRLIAFAYAPEAELSLQHAMVSAGWARVSARAGGKACAEALLTAERTARAGGRGLWADPNFAPLSSENLPGLRAARGQFALVEGKVLSVRESGATIYVNFGRRWTRDFTVTILKRDRRTFAAAGIDLARLEDRHIRVRGWIELHGGPVVDATAPEQIELIE